jgi:hypothetical protein
LWHFIPLTIENIKTDKIEQREIYLTKKWHPDVNGETMTIWLITQKPRYVEYYGYLEYCFYMKSKQLASLLEAYLDTFRNVLVNVKKFDLFLKWLTILNIHNKCVLTVPWQRSLLKTTFWYILNSSLTRYELWAQSYKTCKH